MICAASWSSDQKLIFLDAIRNQAEAGAKPGAVQAVTPERLAALDAAYGFGRSSNVEVRLRWAQIAIAAQYEPGYASMFDFLGSTGRMKSVKPIYEALLAMPGGALHIETAREFYLGILLIGYCREGQGDGQQGLRCH
jgi:hypothetical protein